MLKQLLHLRTLLIALLAMAGAGNGWGQTTVPQTTFSSTSGNVNNDTNVSYTAYKGGGTTTPTIYNNAIRLYQNSSGATGGYVVIGVKEGYVITSATIQSTQATTTGYKLTETSPGNTTPAKNTFAVSDYSLSANTDYTVNGISSRYITFACFGTTSSARLNLSKISITYQAESSSAVQTTTTIDASGITNTDVYTGTEAGSLSASVTAGGSSVEGASVAWTSATPSVATIDSSTGEVTLVAPGTTKITASYAGSNDYAPSSAEYTLTVTSSAPVTEETFTFAGMGYENAQSVTTVSGSACTLTFSDGTNTSNDPTYYTTGSGVRMYNGNTLTISSTTKTIGSIEFTFNGNYTALLLVSNQPGELSGVSNSKRTWTGNANSVQFTTSATNRIQAITITYESHTTSDLSVTSTSSVALDITSADIHPTSTITYTTSSTGTLTFASDDTSVATVSSTGVITAQGEGTATITISQAADDTYKVGEQTVTVNVTDKRSAVVTDIDLPTAQKTLSVGDLDDFAPTATVADGFTGTVFYTFATNDASVVDVDGTTFSAEAPGTATITITATPTGGNAENYKSATQDVDVTVMGETTLQLSTSSVNSTYGTNATVNATVSSGYDGTLTAESSNASIATASVAGTTITITPVAVGTATITVTAPATSTFSGTATETINVTVTAPEGKTTAAQSTITVFNETFDKNEGTGGNDDNWSGNIATNELVTDNSGWTFENGKGANGCAKFGSGSNKGSATTPALRESGTLTLSFRAAAWNGDKTTDGLILSIEGEGTLGTSTFTLGDSQWGSYETTITGATAATKIKFSAAQSSKNRFFLDDIVVTKQGGALTATLNASGYTTYCSEYPLDFSTAEGYSAWQVTGIGGDAITFEKVTGSVKGGTGLLLMGEPSAMVTLASVDSETELTTNLLKGTLAPTYVKANEYYGLSGQQFLKVNPGTVKAGKALLPASVVDNAGNVRTLSLVFVDPTTGIAETKTMTNEDAIYNLAGQRISKAQRGINIIGGKKVLVK